MLYNIRDINNIIPQREDDLTKLTELPTDPSGPIFVPGGERGLRGSHFGSVESPWVRSDVFIFVGLCLPRTQQRV